MDFEICPIVQKNVVELCSRFFMYAEKCLCIAGYGKGRTYWVLDNFLTDPNGQNVDLCTINLQ